MLKVDLKNAKVHVKGDFLTTGSVKAGTIKGECTGVTVDMEAESDATAEEVLHVLRQAENGCYAAQSLRNPTEVATSFTVNGQTVALD